MARGRTSQVNRLKRMANQPQSDNAVASSTQSPAAAPAAGWCEDPALIDSWNNPEDNAWQWEAAGDATIASDDPLREKKMKWRMDNDHIHSYEYRVTKWRDSLGNRPLKTYDEVNTYIETPEHVYRGGRDLSRSRSRSRGRGGRKERLQAVAEWKKKAPVLAQASLAPAELAVAPSPLPTISNELQAWIDELVMKHKYSNVRKDRARAFFELPLDEKVHRVENLSREIGSTMIRV